MMIRSWPRPVSSASSAERSADWIIASIITSRASRGSASAAFASISSVSSCLVERAPVDADAHRLVVVDRDPDDRREVLVVALGADVARVDPVLGERRGHLRVLDQQLVAVVVEVADDRHVDARGRRSLRIISGTAAAACSLLTVTRTSCEPACARRRPGSPWRRRRRCPCSSSTGRRSDGRLPTSTPPTSTVTVGRRRGRRASVARSWRDRLELPPDRTGRCRSR